MPTIVHFDIPSDNVERSKKFYSDLFGWKMDKWSGSSEEMEYWLISTVDDKGNKAIGGGIGKRPKDACPRDGLDGYMLRYRE